MWVKDRLSPPAPLVAENTVIPPRSLYMGVPAKLRREVTGGRTGIHQNACHELLAIQGATIWPGEAQSLAACPRRTRKTAGLIIFALNAEAKDNVSNRVEPIRSVKGTRDLLPPDTSLWQRVEAEAHRVFAAYHYGEIRTPILEETALFARGVGAETDIVMKEMYTFRDRDEESLTLRPEATASVVRAYIEHSLYNQGGIQKLYYIGPMFRRERPQKGRYRQFYQIGAEVLGSQNPLVDVEVIEMLVLFLERVGIREYQLLINSVGCPTCRAGLSGSPAPGASGRQGHDVRGLPAAS